jgi:hypothetical protein
MNNTAILKSLVIYAICVPLALYLGYVLTDPLNVSAFTTICVGLLMLALAFPLLNRWHHPMLLLSWNLPMVIFFLPGSPPVWLLIAGVGFGISLFQLMMGKGAGFIRVPQVAWPLICLALVIIVTAGFRGLGLHNILGGAYGGKRYVLMLGAIMGYFVLLTRRIPLENAGLYLALAFLPGLAAIIGDLWPLLSQSQVTGYLYLFFSPDPTFFATDQFDLIGTRLGGAWAVSFAIFSYLLAKYGIRGVFLSGKHWRWLLLLAAMVYGLFSGFRSMLILYAMIFALQFFLEGLHRTKLLFIFAMIGTLATASLFPLARHLPLSAQRTLSFLPIDIDPLAQQNADLSLNWRIELWKAVLPAVPQYLLLGRGYVMDQTEYELLMGQNAAIQSPIAEDQAMAVAGDFHNGPIGITMIFGIWGAMALLWFFVAGIWALYSNFRYGDPALRTINAFLLAAFVSRTLFFLLIYGAPQYDMLIFCGWLGLGISLNGGVCRPSTQTVPEMNQPQVFKKVRPQLQPALQQENFRA